MVIALALGIFFTHWLIEPFLGKLIFKDKYPFSFKDGFFKGIIAAIICAILGLIFL